MVWCDVWTDVRQTGLGEPHHQPPGLSNACQHRNISRNCGELYFIIRIMGLITIMTLRFVYRSNKGKQVYL